MSTRDYFLASHPYTEPGSGRKVREITERTDGGPWLAVADVAKDDAMDVLSALRRAYQDGRYDRTQELLP